MAESLDAPHPPRLPNPIDPHVTDPTDSFVGRTLGEFVLREKIGEGGFGAVYRAEQPLLEREAVVKMLHRRKASERTTVQRFLREAQVASKLDHPFAAHIYAFGAEPDGVLWIAMEIVRGTPLDRLLKMQGPVELARFVPLFDRLCEVLQTAHDQGIVHRDIKPANVMVLSRAGRLLPKLLDLGIAKLVDDRPALAAPTTSELQVATPRDQAGLTMEGAVLGSPPYMAPEQWTGGAVDARTDIYALGALVYEALTGQELFTGGSLMAIARAHAKGAVPSLGSKFPAALEAVLAKALAKKPDQRYQRVLELAQAFRRAAGFESEEVELPRLPEPLRDAVEQGAPQPLAEAVAALDASRTVPQALQALAQTFEVLARWAGVVALAARTRLGTPLGPDPPVVGDLLALLRRRALTDEEWLDLARGLTVAYLGDTAFYPVPELIALLHQSAELGAAFEVMARVRATVGLRVDDAEAQRLLAQGMEATVQLLQRVAWLSDYPLVVAEAGVALSWSGLRRKRRPRVVARGALPDGQPVLLGKDGAPLLALHPLLALLPPSPQAPPELFFLEGAGRAGARLVALPYGFEHQDAALWDWFREHMLLAAPGQTSARERDEQAPYRGLEPFSRDDAAVFFGREREAEAMANRLRQETLLVVVGPSGAGKSSFVRAGVLSRLTGKSIVVRPGPSPLLTLAAQLGDGDPTALRDELLANPSLLGTRLRALGPVVVVVDQLEELFTLGASAAERVAYVSALVLAAADADSPIRVVATLRDDFLLRAEQLAPLHARLAASLFLLATPDRDALLRVLTEPLRQAGYQFEDGALPEEMVAEVADLPGALPLLSFSALTLWERRDRHFKQLTRAAYRSIGGVGGALAQHAEETLKALRPDEQQHVREAFRHLVTAEGTRAVLRRRDLVQLMGGQTAEGALERLVAARLLVVSDATAGEQRVEVVHEALLAAWPRLVNWRREDADGARLRDQLRAAVRQWDERGRPRGLLWRDEALAEYKLWRARHPQPLTDAEEDFARRGLADAARSQRVRRAVVVTAFTVLSLGLAVLFQFNRRAQRSSLEARSNLASSYEEQGRQLFLDGDPLRALVYFVEARQLGRATIDLRYVLARAFQTLNAQRRKIDHTAAVVDAAFSPDGHTFVTADADGEVRLMATASGARLATIHHPAVTTVLFSPTGEALATVGGGVARLWRASSAEPLFTVAELPVREASKIDHPHDVAFSPDGKTMAVIDRDHTLGLWSLPSGVARRVGDADQSAINSVVFSPDGRSLITASDDHTVRQWDVEARRPTASWTLPGRVLFAAISPDGAQLLAGGQDKHARIWDRATGQTLGELPLFYDAVDGSFSADGRFAAVRGQLQDFPTVWDRVERRLQPVTPRHKAVIQSLAFSPDGTQLLTGAGDGSLLIVDVATDGLVTVLPGHAAAIAHATWSPDGTQVLSASGDGTARLWDPRPAGLARRLADKAAVFNVESDGQRLHVSALDGRSRVYATGTTPVREVGPLMAGGTHLWALGGQRIVAFAKGELELWDATVDPARRALSVHADCAALAWAALSPDGAKLAGACDDGPIWIWSARDGQTQGVLRGHGGGVVYVSFSADGGRLVSSSEDGTARIWDMATLRALHTLRGHAGRVESAEFNPDGTHVLTAGFDQSLRLWSARTGAFEAQLTGHLGQILIAHFSPSGQLIASAGTDGVKIWGAASHHLLDKYGGFDYSARFSPDGEQLLVGQDDDAAIVWDARLDERSPAELARQVRCRVPFALVGDTLMPAATDPAACAP